MIVLEVVDLKDWQTDRDERLIEAVVGAATGSHPEADLSLRPLKLLNAVNVSACELCGEGEYQIRDSQSGITYALCRQCINAVRRRSLHHVQYAAAICWKCEITKDSVGIIDGAVHRTIPYEDEILPSGAMRLGMNALVAVGRVDLTGDILTILP